MDEIPHDVMAKAERVFRDLPGWGQEVDGHDYYECMEKSTAAIARAIMAERERCAKIADDVEVQQDNDNGAANTGGAAAVAAAIRA